MDMPLESSEVAVRECPPVGVFRTNENPLEPGWHTWETNYETREQDWRETGLQCETTIF